MGRRGYVAALRGFGFCRPLSPRVCTRGYCVPPSARAEDAGGTPAPSGVIPLQGLVWGVPGALASSRHPPLFSGQDTARSGTVGPPERVVAGSMSLRSGDALPGVGRGSPSWGMGVAWNEVLRALIEHATILAPPLPDQGGTSLCFGGAGARANARFWVFSRLSH